MILVVDANVLFSALIKDSITAELMFEPGLKLYSCEFFVEEFLKYQNLILEKTHRTKYEFVQVIHLLGNVINVVPHEEYAHFMKTAEKVSPDRNDSMYFALALKLNCAIWSNDKHLKEQNKVKVYSTKDLIEIFKI